MHTAAFDLGLHCLPVTLLGVSRLKLVIEHSVFTVLGSVDPVLTPAIFTLGQTGPVSDPLILLTSGPNTVEDSKEFTIC